MPSAAWRGELKETLRLGLPLALTQLAQIGLETTDVMMMGHLGPEALAAGSLGLNLFLAVLLFGIGVTAATSPLIAQALGRRNARDARRAYRQGLWMAAVIGVPGMAVLWNAESILLALGQPPQASADAGIYLFWASWALVPALMFMVSRALLAAFTLTRVVLGLSIAAIGVNATLNYALMFGNWGFPALGLAGAGIATSIVATLQAAALFLYVTRARRVRRLHVLARLWRPDWPTFGAILRIGLPIGLTMVMEMGMFAAAVFLMGLISLDALAANQIAIQIASITFMVPMGLSQAATVRVGLAVGRGDPAGALRAWQAALAGGLAFMSLAALTFWFAPLWLVVLYLGWEAADQPVAGLAVAFLAVAAGFQLADATQVISSGALRGLKDTRGPMVIAATGFWVIGVPLGALLAFGVGLGGVGIWWGLLAGLVTAAVLLSLRFLDRVRRLKYTDSRQG
ncbi:MATE family efflux transporter [Caenispirillum bisanense]|uniref:MATE family efflux transporter n=1 Tax=Caenispirillum bisanense TaxID=414052 RepID=UPI0031D3B6C2